MDRLAPLALMIWIALTGTALAQDETDPDVDERIERLGSFDLAFPVEGDPGMVSPATRESYEAALRAYYSYREEGYEHRQDVFAWQLLSSRITFFVVLLLVCSGIYFAAIQFHAGLRRSNRDGVPPAEEATELSLSLKEVKVRSPVIGIIVLTISLAFFYLYLVHIYPIENVF